MFDIKCAAYRKASRNGKDELLSQPQVLHTLFTFAECDGGRARERTAQKLWIELLTRFGTIDGGNTMRASAGAPVSDPVTGEGWLTFTRSGPERGESIPLFVLASDAGGFLDEANVRHVYGRILTAAEMRHLKFHGLRQRTRRLLGSGATLTYVRDQMGDESIQVTADVYGRFIPDWNLIGQFLRTIERLRRSA